MHKSILSMQCDWFRKTFTNGMIESTSNAITLGDEDSAAVGPILEFLYRNNYNAARDAVANSSISAGSQALFDVSVYSLADKYGLPALAELAAVHFVKDAGAHWDADLFRQIVRRVYDCTPPNDQLLRRRVTDIATKNSKALLNDAQFLAEFVNSGSDFGLEFCKLVGELVDPNVRSYRCGNCNAQWKAAMSEFAGSMKYCVSCGAVLSRVGGGRPVARSSHNSNRHQEEDEDEDEDM